MTTDIVERLHLSANPECWEAADEIERLRAERDEMAQQTHSLAFMIDEIARLRAALELSQRQNYCTACGVGLDADPWSR